MIHDNIIIRFTYKFIYNLRISFLFLKQSPIKGRQTCSFAATFTVKGMTIDFPYNRIQYSTNGTQMCCICCNTPSHNIIIGQCFLKCYAHLIKTKSIYLGYSYLKIVLDLSLVYTVNRGPPGCSVVIP